MKRMKRIVFCLLVCQVLTGCVHPYPPKGEAASIGYFGNITASQPQFSMQGTLIVDVIGAESPKDRFEDVHLVLYSANRSIVYCQSLDDLYIDSSVNVSVETPTMPEYIIFTSPDFWSEDITVEYMEKDPEGHNGYAVRVISRPEQLPVGSDFSSCEEDK